MLRQRLSDPAILPVVCRYEQYEVVTRCIVRMEEICDESQKTQAAGNDDELVFLSQLLEYLLLVFLRQSVQLGQGFECLPRVRIA